MTKSIVYIRLIFLIQEKTHEMTITVVPVATSDIRYFEQACKEVKVRYYKLSGDDSGDEIPDVHRLVSTLFLLGWLTAKYKYSK